MIVGCGAWSAPLLLVAYLSVASSTLTWSVAFYVLALFFNYPHYMATVYRAYHRSEDFNKYRIFTVHITLLVLLTAVVSHFWFRALPFIFTLYLTWSPWHYSGQNYGILMMFARRAGARPAEAVRHAMYAAFLLSYAILFLNFHTGPSTDPLFHVAQHPRRGQYAIADRSSPSLSWSASAYALSSLIGQTGWRGMVPSLTLFSTQFVWFLLPTVLSLGRTLPRTAEPLQHGRAGGDALRSISLDHQLLRRTRSPRRRPPELAPACLLRCADRRWHRPLHSRPVDREPCLPFRFHAQLPDLHRAGEHPPFHS